MHGKLYMELMRARRPKETAQLMARPPENPFHLDPEELTAENRFQETAQETDSRAWDRMRRMGAQARSISEAQGENWTLQEQRVAEAESIASAEECEALNANIETEEEVATAERMPEELEPPLPDMDEEGMPSGLSLIHYRIMERRRAARAARAGLTLEQLGQAQSARDSLENSLEEDGPETVSDLPQPIRSWVEAMEAEEKQREQAVFEWEHRDL